MLHHLCILNTLVVSIVGMVHLDEKFASLELLSLTQSILDLSLALLVVTIVVGILHAVQQLNFPLSITHTLRGTSTTLLLSGNELGLDVAFRQLSRLLQ